MTKKEIVKQISDRLGLTQLKTKEIVQQTFDAIVDTLLEVGRIELRNFGVFEVKERKPRRARNPRTGERVDVPRKFVVTFKPGKEMEERVRAMTDLPKMDEQTGSDDDADADSAGTDEHVEPATPTGTGTRGGRARKATGPDRSRQPS